MAGAVPSVYGMPAARNTSRTCSQVRGRLTEKDAHLVEPPSALEVSEDHARDLAHLALLAGRRDDLDRTGRGQLGRVDVGVIAEHRRRPPARLEEARLQRIQLHEPEGQDRRRAEPRRLGRDETRRLDEQVRGVVVAVLAERGLELPIDARELLDLRAVGERRARDPWGRCRPA